MSLALLNQVSCQCIPNSDFLILAHRHNLVALVVKVAAKDLYPQKECHKGVNITTLDSIVTPIIISLIAMFTETYHVLVPFDSELFLLGLQVPETDGRVAAIHRGRQKYILGARMEKNQRDLVHGWGREHPVGLGSVVFIVNTILRNDPALDLCVVRRGDQEVMVEWVELESCKVGRADKRWDLGSHTTRLTRLQDTDTSTTSVQWQRNKLRVDLIRGD